MSHPHSWQGGPGYRLPPNPSLHRGLSAHLLDGPDALGLYRAIADQLPHGAIFVVDTELRYVLAAGASLRDAGFTPADFEGRLLSEVLPDSVLDSYERDYRAMLAGASITSEHSVNGVDFISHGTPLADGAGIIRAALVVSYDVSAQKRERRRLQLFDALAGAARSETTPEALEARAAVLLEQYFDERRGERRGDLHGDTGGELRCLFVPVSALPGQLLAEGCTAVLDDAAMTALSAGEAVHDDGAWAAADPARPAAARAFIACAQCTGGPAARAALVLSASPRAWSAADIALVRECADRVGSHAERLRLVAALQEADRQKDRFLAVLAHELRNPLSVARNGLALLRRGNQQAPSDHLARLVERQFGHMGRLIEDLLDTSQLCRGQLSLRRERLSLRDLVEAAVDAARGLADSKGLALEVGLPDAALQVDADPTRLAQALGNVIANAIKYTPAPGTVGIEAGEDAGWAWLRVADTGLGMSAVTLERLFDLFVRGSDIEAAGAVGGLGVGLWVTRQLVEAHGGTIEASSEGPGRGSVFLIRLPLAGGDLENK